MAQTKTKQEILDALWDKHQAIVRYLKKLNRLLTPGQRRDHAGDLANGELEMNWVWACREEIKNDGSLAFPSDEQVRALALATGALQQITNQSEAYEELIAAATALIETWPVSGGEPEE